MRSGGNGSSMDKEVIAKKLLVQSLNARYSEKLIPNSFQDNDSYKVCYRFISNLTTQWREFELEHFPTEEEVVEIAKMAHPYFVWLFEQKDELGGFKSTSSGGRVPTCFSCGVNAAH